MSESTNSTPQRSNNTPSEDIKKRLELPAEALFCGYLVHIEQESKFLSSVMETTTAMQRRFVKAPEQAQRFNEFGEAYNARRKKDETVVALFDLGSQLFVYPL